jgi:GNAT superfamily N-acetyltransferase
MKSFELRPAGWADQAAVAALAAQIWDGEDYLADCFADWVQDSEGQFTLVMAGSELAACSKLTRLAPQEWWLEGLRVDPRFRGQGLARRLHDSGLALIRQRGGGWVRLATACDNPAVPRIAYQSGFSRQNSYLHTKLSLPTAAAPDRFALVEAEELPQFEAQLRASPAFSAQNGLLEDGWIWYEILPRLSRMQSQGRLFWWPDRESRRAVLIANAEEGEKLLGINFCGAQETDLPAVVADLPRLAAHFQRWDLRFKPVDTAVNRAALNHNDWFIDPETVLCVFERYLP